MSRTWNRAMLVFAAGCAVLVVVAALGWAFDDRLLLGAPIWVKPLKFAISGLVYGLTWAWLTTLIDRRHRLVHRTSTVVAVLLTIELVIITGQAFRGRRSHFNFETLFDAILYEIMAVSIVAVWAGALVLTVLVVRSDIRDHARKVTVSLGAVLSLIGIGLGALMTAPTGAQVTSMKDGNVSILDSTHGDGFHTLGAHTVGGEDGGPGLPLLGWSTTGGDLRIPHFVGMHALQALLVLNVVLALLAARWPALAPTAVRANLIRIGAAGFAAMLALVTWQAFRGQPLLSPDVWTVLAGSAIILGMAIAAVRTLRTTPVSSEPEPEEIPAPIP